MAQKGDSIFKAGNIIKAEELEGEKVEQAQIAMDTNAAEMRAKGYERTGLSRSAKMDAIMDKLNGGLVGFAKKERGIEYCEAASRRCKANGFKEWRYLFIPAG